ncbi:MAG: glutamate 5-kinase [Chloroflexi bacterium]|nr:glutamate 5-kinase [Chloroflexota bacterium]
MPPQRDLTSTVTDASSKRGRAPYRRIVVKAGTSLLTRDGGRLDQEMMAGLVDQIARLHTEGADTILVTSGAVAAGRHVLDAAQHGKDLPFRQVLAAVGQSHLMHAYEQLFSAREIVVAQALLSRSDLSDRLGYLNIRNTLLGLLERRVVPIVNENDVVAVDELAGDAFGDNDTLSAMVANLVDADLLVMLGQVQGLFTADPNVDREAQLVPTVESLSEEIETMGGPSWEGAGRGGMTTKLDAARLATASGVDTVIASGHEPEVLMRLVDGEAVGTAFPATRTKMESRKRWMLAGVSTRGEIVVDGGAVKAVTRQNRSLLPAGVTDVLGSFHRGDIVSILEPARAQIACGIANYSSEELTRIRGLHSDRIADILGHQYGDEVVHRNNMVVL